MYTCKYRGASCVAPLLPASLRAWAHSRAASGGGCAASNRACRRCAHAATNVDRRSNLFGAKAPPNPMRRSTTTPARPSPSHHRKHWVHQSARCTGQNRYADSASTTYRAASSRRASAGP
eukprot:4784014-Pleurochrysis_carterae.AAC.1